MKRKTGRVFVGTLPTMKQRIQARQREVERNARHLKAITEQALQIATTLYPINEVKPDAQTMLVFLVATMVSLDLDREPEDIMEHMREYAQDFSKMGVIFFLQCEQMGTALPSDFPFTLEQLREAVDS